jgi:hypothetical protein
VVHLARPDGRDGAAVAQERQEGFIPVVYESKTGKLLLEITRAIRG